MKKFFLGVLVLFVLILGVGLYLVVTFDADRLRPFLVSQAQKALGRPVEIGRLSLTYHNGLALRIQDLKIQPPLLELSEATANLSLFALLRKEVRVSSLTYLKPVIHIIKKADGSIDLGPSETSALEKPLPDHSPARAPVVFSVDKILIKDGEFYFHDDTKPGTKPFRIGDIDATILDFSFEKPFVYDLAMALSEEKHNFFLTGKADLAQVALEITDGNISMGPKRLENIRAKGVFQDGVVRVEHVEGRFAGGQMRISGALEDPAGRALMSLKAVFQDLSIAEIIPAQSKNSAFLQGRLTAHFDGQGQGRELESLLGTLNGQGRIQIQDGVIMNKNILGELLKKLSRIPLVGDSLVGLIPPAYRAKANEPHTLLAPVDFPIEVRDGGMTFNNLSVLTEYCQVGVAGRVGFNRSVEARAILWMSPELSGTLVGVAPNLKVLANAQGLLEVPLSIDGVLPQLKVQPDTEYLTKKFLAVAAGQMMEKILSKPSQDGSSVLTNILGGGSQSADPASQENSSDILGSLLSKIKKKSDA